jgi:undecaprenyl phosphate N,N'-diacetylbacillosamine 1-phosphate transferase
MYKLVIKSIFDFIISFVILIMMFPILFGATIILFIANDGKPFFFQLRPGINGQLFNIIKFKTMNDKKDSNGNLLPDVFRLTKMGQLVRKTSLDEIPQLFNVLKGDMSLIGPRPLLPEYLPLYNETQRKRHEVKPGITGWAQVNGRNSISWQQKFEYDTWYVDNISFILDCKILFLTISKVFKKEGISQRGRVTVDYFKGNE